MFGLHCVDLHNAARTAPFDRLMFCLYGALLFGLFAGAAFYWALSGLP